jgi:hypothetical protein
MRIYTHNIVFIQQNISKPKTNTNIIMKIAAYILLPYLAAEGVRVIMRRN